MTRKEIYDSYFLMLRIEVEEPGKKAEFSLDRNNHHLLSDRGKYLLAVLNYQSKITGILDDMRKAQAFIKYLPYKQQLDRMQLNPLECLQYHTEVYFHKVSTLLDLMKLTANTAFEINLPEKRCSWKDLEPKIDNPTVVEIMNQCFEAFKSLREARQFNTHRAIYKDEKTEWLQTLYFLRKHGEGKIPTEKEDYLLNEYILKYQSQSIIKEKIKFFKHSTEVADQYVEVFYLHMLRHVIGVALKKKGAY